MHAGVCEYYVGDEWRLNRPEYGSADHVEALVRSFPAIGFIIGHAGLSEVDEIRRRLAGLDNVWVDTSFHSPESIRTLMETFGPERVLYASDWPWGHRNPGIRSVRVACRGDAKLESLLFYENARELLPMSESTNPWG